MATHYSSAVLGDKGDVCVSAFDTTSAGVVIATHLKIDEQVMPGCVYGNSDFIMVNKCGRFGEDILIYVPKTLQSCVTVP